jgi:hypothetical protein
MYALIAIFYVSFACIAAMLWSKQVEMRTGRQSLVSRLGDDADHVLHRINDDARSVVSYFNKHTFIAFLQWIAAHILSWFRNLYIKLYHMAHRHPHSKKVIDMVRGQGEVNQNGGASFFLKKISDDSDAGSTTPRAE